MDKQIIMEPINKSMVTEITIAYRPRKRALNRPKIITLEDAIDAILCGFNKDTMMLQEQFVVLYLNQTNSVLGVFKASIGGISGTVIDTRIIFSVGLKLLATKMIIAHNHPSGNVEPSIADEELTLRLQQAGEIMEIRLIDHLIFDAFKNYYSFAGESYW